MKSSALFSQNAIACTVTDESSFQLMPIFSRVSFLHSSIWFTFSSLFPRMYSFYNLCRRDYSQGFFLMLYSFLCKIWLPIIYINSFTFTCNLVNMWLYFVNIYFSGINAMTNSNGYSEFPWKIPIYFGFFSLFSLIGLCSLTNFLLPYQ